jgi:hypothetical protein
MARGMAPVDSQRRPLNLHHLTGQERQGESGRPGSLVVVNADQHRALHGTNSDPSHPNPNYVHPSRRPPGNNHPRSIPQYPSFRRDNDGNLTDQNDNYDEFRAEYWRQKAEQIERERAVASAAGQGNGADGQSANPTDGQRGNGNDSRVTSGGEASTGAQRAAQNQSPGPSSTAQASNATQGSNAAATTQSSQAEAPPSISAPEQSLDELSNAGRQPDKSDKSKQLTKAGRALQKHQAGGRADSTGKYPSVGGPPENWNEQGQRVLDEILTDPGSQFKRLGRGGVQVTAPDGRAVRFNADGSFSGFLD